MTLFFLPGVGADPGFWRPVGDHLLSNSDKVYFGWPGLGNQPADPGVNGYDDLIALVERQLPDHPVDLLAQSMGGLIALSLALRHPARIRRLVLAVTSGGLDVTRFGAQDWRPDYNCDYPNGATWITGERPDISKHLGEVLQPTLLLWGDADPISPVAVGRYLAERLRNGTLHIVEGGGHDLIYRRASEVTGLISTHLTA
ncbi:alpha/beta fold hydrolase [Asticcacaulis sp. 201]|uniref:alpha/beta fold hydrolase n=1 Tax=Asticcacaulis sp. 201 TaxID=3028787 RepID=UPI002916E395|nr:alpha/beta fold hydrolase [Asticcacaulis sp. 201]MDV6329452.1 alpha/beta fold hydrolase [Asticcacaulis sp. 201]